MAIGVYEAEQWQKERAKKDAEIARLKEELEIVKEDLDDQYLCVNIEQGKAELAHDMIAEQKRKIIEGITALPTEQVSEGDYVHVILHDVITVVEEA